MPLLLATPPLCTYVEASTVLSVHDVVLLGEVAKIRDVALARARGTP